MLIGLIIFHKYKIYTFLTLSIRFMTFIICVYINTREIIFKK